MSRAARRSFVVLTPLCFWIGIALCYVFYTHSGHHWAASPTVYKNEAVGVCADESLTPHAARVPWGQDHGRPLVVLHISDLHISDADGGVAKKYAREFVEDVLPRFSNVADVLAVTGDLVSAKQYPWGPLKRFIGYKSVQLVEEWEWFNRTIAQAVPKLGTGKMLFVAVPGNHDTFGSRRFFDKFILSKASPVVDAEDIKRVRVEHVRGHTITALDATLFPSPHRPLNFFGNMDSQTARHLQQAFSESRSNSHLGASVCLCHYPSSVLGSGSAVDSATIAAAKTRGPTSVRSTVYLSGHLHSMRNALPYGMQAVSKSGRIELQQPDMASTGSFRVLAVDHGVPSWADFKIPVDARQQLVVVMNPPRAGLCPPGAGFAALKSSHIRLLVLPAAIGDGDLHGPSLSVYVDGSFVGHPVPVSTPAASTGAKDNHSSVFTVPWNSKQYWEDGNVHNLDVFVGKGRARRLLLHHPFSLKGQLPPGTAARLGAFFGAFFTLSHFDKIAREGVLFGLFSALGLGTYMLLGLPHLRRQAVFVLGWTTWMLLDGPLLISRDLSEPGGMGFASLSAISVQEGYLVNPVDPLFAMFFVVNTALVPAVYLGCLEGTIPDSCLSWPFDMARLLVLVRSFSWTLNVTGAHGLLAAIISPSCLPQTCLVTWCCFGQRARSRSRLKEKGI